MEETKKEQNYQKINEWKKKNQKCISFNFAIKEDKEVIDKITSQKNKVDYIRQLVLADIAEEKRRTAPKE